MKLTNEEVLRAQNALKRLMELELPVKVSLDIAIISNSVDQEVKAWAMVRDRLFKTYAIKTEPGETEDTVKFFCTAEGENEGATEKLRTENLEAFGEKLTELMEAKTDDLISKKIQLPQEVDGKPLQVKPEILKALTEFVEIG